MKRPFTKMHGLGNDFAVFEASTLDGPLSAGRIRALADRRRGIGFDQLLLIDVAGEPVGYHVYNADGSEVEQCGNGVRCLARWLVDQGHRDGPEIRLHGAAGAITAWVLSDGRVRVDMGRPSLQPQDIPLRQAHYQPRYRLDVDGEGLEFAAVSMGNPHAVMEVASAGGAEVSRLGPALEQHQIFPEGANIGFMEILDRSHVRLRVHERGAGETQACGSGACAAVVAGRSWERLDSVVEVALPGGRLEIQWDHSEAPVLMTGAAETAYEGVLDA